MTLVCETCGKEFETVDPNDNTPYCGDCMWAGCHHILTCERCGKEFEDVDDSETLCQDCKSETQTICERCGKEVSSGELFHYGDEFLCSDCVGRDD